MGFLQECQRTLGYQFKDVSLLQKALRHRSVGEDNNERLEFLGDAVLGIIITHDLYKQYPARREGDLSRLRSMLVNGLVLSELAIALSLDRFLEMGSGEEKTRSERKASILADAMEAVIGAVYLDAGMEVCRERVLSWYQANVKDVSTLAPKKDAKSILQEWCQSHQKPLPEYVCEVSGPAHEQLFTVICTVQGLDCSITATGLSRRKAEQEAAKQFWEWLRES